jgi:hypothetical protein
MNRTITLVVAGVLALSTAVTAVGGDKAEYIGGTVSTLKEKAEGTLSTKAETEVVFTAKGSPPLTIPYNMIDSLEYGQKAGRRVAVAVLVSPLALFSKKRNHYLTISYKDEAGKDQAAVFELGKGIVRTTLTVLETRTGKEIEYQDEEARKASKGGD